MPRCVACLARALGSLLLGALLLGPGAATAGPDAPSFRALVRQTAGTFARPGNLAAKRALLRRLVGSGRVDAWLILMAALEQEGRHLERLAAARVRAWDRTVDLWRLPRRQHHAEVREGLRRRFEELSGADRGWFQESMLRGQMEALLRGAPAEARAEFLRGATAPGPKLHPIARMAVAGLLGPGLATAEDLAGYRDLLERDPDVRVRLAALTALPPTGELAGPLLLRRLRDPNWVVRVAAAQALAERGVPGAGPQLERAAARARPREAQAHATALRALGARPQEVAAATSVFGEPVRGDRVVFVVDASAGAAARFGEIVGALRGAIERLPAGAHFGIVAYSGAVEAWRPEAVPATPENKAAATQWLDTLEASWHACLGGALRQAFRMAGLAPAVAGTTPVDTIVVLAAAAPTYYGLDTPRAQPPEELLRLARAWNRHGRLRIQTVALGDGAAGLLGRLAREHGGTSVRR